MKKYLSMLLCLAALATFSACDPELDSEEPNPAAVSKKLVATGSYDKGSLTASKATVQGQIDTKTDMPVTRLQYGILYSSTAKSSEELVLGGKDVYYSTVHNVSKDGMFSVQLAGLTRSTTYYYRAYAMLESDREQMRYGEIKSFTTTDGRGSTDGHEWVDLGLPSGTLWATCNLGSKDQYGEGNYYAWGETQTKTYYSNSSTYYKHYNKPTGDLRSNGVLNSSNVLTSNYDAATANWGENWRMPTQSEMNELCSYCQYKWIKSGAEFTGPNGNSIYLPAAGYKEGSYLYSNSSSGYYWTSTANYYSYTYYSSYNYKSYRLYFYSYSSGAMSYDDRYYGYPIRPVVKSN